MALGGGTFLTQNKILPGAYMNFVSMARASATLSDRGVATMPLVLDWGPQGAVMEVSAADFQKSSLKLFGYDYTAPQLMGLRDLFRNIRLAYLYRLGTGGTKAYNIYATAKYEGLRGNDLMVVVAENVDDPTLYDVYLYLGASMVDHQVVPDASGLVDNDFVAWQPGAALTPTAGTPLAGGVNPMPANSDFQTYLDVMEGYSFNAMGCPSSDAAVKSLFAAFTKRLRDDQGVKFQSVVYNPQGNSDFEGVIDVLNSSTIGDEWSAVYWVTGVIAGTPVNRSALNKVYDSEFTLDTSSTQTQLENAIKGGKFAFHRVGSDIRVLADINSLVTITVEKGEDFKQNQTIRVIDQIANDIAVLFNTRYLGIVPNDADGRVSLWADIVKYYGQMQTIRAIENFNSDDLTIAQGDTKRSVVINGLISVVNAMEQLYMTTVIA